MVSCCNNQGQLLTTVGEKEVYKIHVTQLLQEQLMKTSDSFFSL